MKTNKPLLGLALACLTLSLASCANKPQNVRTETVEVAVPVIVGVPSELTDVPAEPVLPVTTGEARATGGSSCPPDAPADELGNCVLADHIEALRAWGRGLADQLREIAGLEVRDESRGE